MGKHQASSTFFLGATCHLACHRRERGELLALGERLNGEGLRVLAVAVRQLPDMETALSAAGTGASEPGTPTAPLTPSAWKEASGHSGHSGHGMCSPSSPAGAAGTAGASPSWLATSSARFGASHSVGLSGSGGGSSPLAHVAASRRSSMTSIATQRAVSLEDEQDLIFVGFLAFLVGAVRMSPTVGCQAALTLAQLARCVPQAWSAR